MASDPQLESLKQLREDARSVMNEKKKEFDFAKAHRDDMQRTYGSMVEQLKQNIDSMYAQQKSCREDASAAWGYGDKSRAKQLSDEAKDYNSQINSAKRQREDYIAKMKSAREAVNLTRAAYEKAKASFEEWRDAVSARRDELDRERASKAFGTGNEDSTYERENFTAPVHGVTSDGRPVTAAFGKGKHEGETLITRGHAQGPKDFYGSEGNKEHDHFDKDGDPGKSGDRGKSD